MRTLSRIKSGLSVIALTLYIACTGEPEANVDAEWSDMTSEERSAHLEDRLTQADENLRAATNLEEWDVANHEAQLALSLLRPEIWAEDRARYVELESELEALTRATREAL